MHYFLKFSVFTLKELSCRLVIMKKVVANRTIRFSKEIPVRSSSSYLLLFYLNILLTSFTFVTDHLSNILFRSICFIEIYIHNNSVDELGKK